MNNSSEFKHWHIYSFQKQLHLISVIAYVEMRLGGYKIKYFFQPDSKYISKKLQNNFRLLESNRFCCKKQKHKLTLKCHWGNNTYHKKVSGLLCVFSTVDMGLFTELLTTLANKWLGQPRALSYTCFSLSWQTENPNLYSLWETLGIWFSFHEG